MNDVRLDTDPDFILLKRFNFSLKKALERYPDGMSDDMIAKALGCSEPAVERLYQSAVAKLRGKLTTAGLGSWDDLL